MKDAIAHGEPTSSGLATLDVILGGGYAANRAHLIEGRPGAGKTTLALQFLVAGNAIGESGLYITLSENREELLYVAGTHGMDMSNITICELVPPETSLDAEMEQTILYASDLELNETIALLMATVRAAKPHRVVLDSLLEIRLLCQTPLRFRRQARALKNFFSQQGCTVVFLDDVDESVIDNVNLHSLVHGVIRLEHAANAYGSERRRLRVYKMRARKFIGGYHDYKIINGGIQIFPRLIASNEGRAKRIGGKVASGLIALDAMLDGGLDRGTSTVIIGPGGVGKTSLGMQYIHAMLQAGEKTLFISFDETERNFCRRNEGIGIDLAPMLADGRFQFYSADPAELAPGELTEMIRMNVETGVTGIVIDSLNGYRHAMPEDKFMLMQLHELVTFLDDKNIVTILIVCQSGIIGTMQSPFEIKYLSNTVLLLRYFEYDSEMRRAISVMKSRTGPHSNSVHEFSIDKAGMRIGDVLANISGVLAGMPVYSGEHSLPGTSTL